jgi:ABC-type sugar transport system permease subunit
MKKPFGLNKVIVLIVILITTIFLLPLVIGGFAGIDFLKLFSDHSNGFSSSLLRTTLFAIFSAITNVMGGFCIALLLLRISSSSKIGRQLSFFILPVTFGNVAIAFVFKVLLFDTTIFNTIVHGGNAIQILLVLFIQFWQFGFLFAYLFWLRMHGTPKRIEDYSTVVGLSKFEKVRDIILPQTKNLFILLMFIGFIFSFNEDVKSQFIFRASQGTETELINHWLYRTYQSKLLINPDYANQSIFKVSLVVFTITLLIFSALGSLMLLLHRFFSKIQSSKRVSVEKEDSKAFSNISFTTAIICISIIIIPILLALLKSQYQYSNNIFSITFPFALTCIAAFVATGFTIIFGISSRLAFSKLLSGFNSKSLLYFLAVFLLQIVPPLCIVLCGFKWLSWIGYNSNLLIYLTWIAGHTILTLPLLGSFVLATHFSLRENELNYLTAYQISGSDVVKYSFLKRFKAEYALTLLFAFSFIWNDAGLNMVLSDKIPSFASSLQMLFIGRAANYSKATNFVLVALILSILCVFIWQYILNKTEKLREAK